MNPNEVIWEEVNPQISAMQAIGVPYMLPAW